MLYLSCFKIIFYKTYCFFINTYLFPVTGATVCALKSLSSEPCQLKTCLQVMQQLKSGVQAKCRDPRGLLDTLYWVCLFLGYWEKQGKIPLELNKCGTKCTFAAFMRVKHFLAQIPPRSCHTRAPLCRCQVYEAISNAPISVQTLD